MSESLRLNTIVSLPRDMQGHVLKSKVSDCVGVFTQLLSVDGVTVYGPQPERRGSPLCAFNVEGIHPTDLSTFLDFEGDLPTIPAVYDP